VAQCRARESGPDRRKRKHSNECLHKSRGNAAEPEGGSEYQWGVIKRDVMTNGMKGEVAGRGMVLFGGRGESEDFQTDEGEGRIYISHRREESNISG